MKLNNGVVILSKGTNWNKKKKQLGSTPVHGGVAMLSYIDEFWTL